VITATFTNLAKTNMNETAINNLTVSMSHAIPYTTKTIPMNINVKLSKQYPRA